MNHRILRSQLRLNDFSLQIAAVIVTKMPSHSVVVLLTETAMETRVVIPEVEEETVPIPVSHLGDEAALGEVATPAEVRATKEAMEEGVRHSRMAHGTRWEEATTATMLIHNSRRLPLLLALLRRSIMHLSL